jgi:hypothetical protein
MKKGLKHRSRGLEVVWNTSAFCSPDPSLTEQVLKRREERCPKNHIVEKTYLVAFQKNSFKDICF